MRKLRITMTDSFFGYCRKKDFITGNLPEFILKSKRIAKTQKRKYTGVMNF